MVEFNYFLFLKAEFSTSDFSGYDVTVFPCDLKIVIMTSLVIVFRPAASANYIWMLLLINVFFKISTAAVKTLKLGNGSVPACEQFESNSRQGAQEVPCPEFNADFLVVFS